MDFGEVAKKALAPDAAPDSLVARYGLVTLKGMGNMPKGILHAAEDDWNHPWQTVGMVAGAAAVGAIVKTLLPKTGTVGKIAGIAIAGYATYKAAEPAFDAYSIAGQAKTMNDIDVAAKVLGDFGGSMAFNSALLGAAYKLGGMGAEKYFELPKPSGGVSPNWTGAVAARMPSMFSIATASSTSMSFDMRVAGIQKFTASESNAPDGDYKGITDPNTVLDVTVQLKSKASDKEMEDTLNDVATGKRPQLNDSEFADKFGASKESLDQLTKFAEAYGLKVSESDLRSGRVVLTGTAENFSEAFKTKIAQYDQDGLKIRGREGALFVPKSVGKNIEGVFGLDTRPQAQPRIKDFDPKTNDAKTSDNVQPISFRPDEIANAYNFPKGTTGKGQAAALVELGGGIDFKNETEFYKENGLKVPEIKVLEINGAKNSLGKNMRADKEVSLDSQVLGSVAPDAKQTIIFAPNNEQGFIDAVGRASFPKETDNTHQAISISWGQPIEDWTEQSKRSMNLALKKAALKGISVFVASGDDGAIDKPGSKAQVDYPAGDPYAIGVGGTRITIKDGKLASEVAWNDQHGSTGGGISSDPLPDFQQGLKVANAVSTGRGVPDIAGNASPASGYKVRINGENTVTGGTSAAAPLYAALALRLNEGLGGNRTVGFMNPFLYKQGLSGNATFFNDVTQGNNNGFDAGKGWDAATGWGSLDGEKLLQAYKDNKENK